MTTPVSLLTWSAAILPIVLLLYLLIIRQWAVVDAAIFGLITTLITAFFVFKAPILTLSVEITKGVWNSLSIIAVIIPAIFLYELSLKVNAFKSIQQALTQMIPDRFLQVLAIGWCFASFLQGPSGFGVPIAVTAPILIGIGIRPFYAVAIPLIGHSWAGTFGTLGLGWQALMQQIGINPTSPLYLETALWTTLFTGIVVSFSGFLIAYIYGGMRAIKHGFPAIVILGCVFFVGQMITSHYFSALSAVVPSTIALGVIFLIAKLPCYQGKSIPCRIENVASDRTFATNNDTKSTSISFFEALLPYLVLVFLSAIVLIVPSIKKYLGQFTMSLSFARTTTGYGFENPAIEIYGQVAWFTHSGFFLLVSALITYIFFYAKGLIKKAETSKMLRVTIEKSVPPALSIMLLLIMSKVMNGSNQIGVLALGTATVTGGYYTYFTPLVGMIGTFMSSSNVSSNILFAEFQSSMAEITGKNVALLLAAQTGGGAVGTMISPSNLLLGVTTAGILGQEGNIIKKLLPFIVFLVIIIGILTRIFA
ncbi:L-lactate permease [Thorsellia kenyensis]|uniref:L-lactate permease n=1 Tax=Thorsellia kenyensis TaxID=1549888 RepID=A0ABV6C7J9_9GAMM